MGRIVLIVSRLIPKKRVDLSILAFARVADRIPESTLVIGGRGPEADPLNALIADLGLTDRVRMVGFIPERELWDYYVACDVFVNLDVADSKFVSDVALALGRKVVLTTDAEWEESGSVGRFVFRGSPTEEAIAKALVRALNAEPEPLTLADREVLGQLTWESYAARLIRPFEEGDAPSPAQS